MCPLCLTVAGLVAGGAAAAAKLRAHDAAARTPVEGEPQPGDATYSYDSPPRNVFSGTAPMRAENQSP